MTTLFCLAATWLFIALMFYESYLAIKQGRQHLIRLHTIPCSRCAFCTGDYRLKCTVHPLSACTECAIGCLDFESCSATKISHEVSDYVPF
jgi:hypothetical protein